MLSLDFNNYSYPVLRCQNSVINRQNTANDKLITTRQNSVKVAPAFCGVYQDDIFTRQINYAWLEKYDGPKEKNAGVSLDPGPYSRTIGLFRSGGYVVEDIDTPISTVGMYECAAIYIPNAKKNEHFLWHIGQSTPVEKIVENLRDNKLPCNKVWIAKGCVSETSDTVDNIIKAVKSINPKAKVVVVAPNPEQEVVGYKGELFGSDAVSYVSFATPRTATCG